MKPRVLGAPLPAMPWEERPGGSDDPVWRYSRNPVIGRRAVKRAGRVFNSAVIPYGDGFVGVFLADHPNG